MRLSRLILPLGILLLAAIASLIVALVAARSIEQTAATDLKARFLMEGIEGVSVETNGLQVMLNGVVANEAARFHTISVAGNVIDSARVIDQLDVAETAGMSPPRFSVEILRNDEGISLIGLIPSETSHKDLSRRVGNIADGARVADLLESADYPEPDKWEIALDYALDALERLPQSKISVGPNKVEIIAIATSADEKRSLETTLARMAPGGLELGIHISAPRPVITPFTLRFLLDQDGARFDACSAHTAEGRDAFIAAARKVGLVGKVDCTLGLGVPTPEWPVAVAAGIEAVGALGGGSITFSDADITLVALENTPTQIFDRVTGELESALPEVFSLHAILPEPVQIDGTGDSDSGPPEFVATLSPEGQVQLRGRVSDDIQREIADSYARAQFGVNDVYSATRIDPDLPRGWATRVLAGLEVLGFLSNGSVVVQPDIVEIRGKTGVQNANSEISRILSDKLGDSEDFRVKVTYVKALDPEAEKPTPVECANSINAVLETSKITFAPGSAEIAAEARQTIDKIAEIMKNCQDIAMEIGGYTDSQGREEMNRALSQSRAQAVLNALLARRVLTTNLTAYGYGEENPIADNGTEAGREANRRIEFRLILPEDENGGGAGDTTATPAQPTEGDAAAAATDTGTDDAAHNAEDH